MQVDYLITGQGICGTLLSYHLLKEGAEVLVIDDGAPFAASRVASGLINPVTGKRYVPSWMTEELMPAATDAYRSLEEALDVPLIRRCDVLNFFPTAEARDGFVNRIPETTHLQLINDETLWQPYFRFGHNIGLTSPCWLINLNLLLRTWRKRLSSEGRLLEATFDWQDCTVLTDKIVYRDIAARKIICCEGTAGYGNPYFSLLPYTQNKGELLIASIPGLPQTHIFQQGIKIAPWQEGLWWIGSSFEWKFTEAGPTRRFREQVETQLKRWLRLPYEIKDHIASTRPTTVDYKPFAGLHPAHRAVGALNGMGTKGCSLAPYFARQLSDHLLHQQPLLPEADIRRFTRILSRQ